MEGYTTTTKNTTEDRGGGRANEGTNGGKTRAAAERYIKSNFQPIPVPGGEKNPNRKGWQNERRGLEDVPEAWNNGQNIGLLLGEPSGGLVDVDLDRREARAVARYLLPETLRSGREGCPDSHRWYRVNPTPRTRSFKLPGDGEDRSVVELRSTGAQTLVAPSVHPSGGRYAWGVGELAQIDAAVLSGHVEDVAAAALLVMNWPGPGSRHDFVLSAAGYLARNMGPDRAQRIMEAAIHASDDEELYSRLKDVETTLNRLAAGEPTTGGPTLEGLAPGVPVQLARWGCVKHSGGHPNDDNGTPPTLAPGERFALTDLGNADRFVARYGERVLWCEGMRAYLVWDGKRWAKDEGGGSVVKRAQEVARSIHREAADQRDTDAQRRVSRWAVASQNAARIGAMLAMARPHLAVSINALDSDPWLLNCQNGTLDLRTGELRPHDPLDLITKIVPVAYEPDAEAPRFEAFLREVLVDDGVIGFVQRFAGYSLTGDTRERAMTILWGSGKNGKSTLVELLLNLLGDYADSTDVETVLTRKHAGVGNDVAALKGHRFVSCSEVEKGRRLAESKVKQLTGRDTITARFLFCEPFSFRPEFKLWMSTNNKPEIVGTDDAIWDRIRLVPFTRRFDGKAEDPTLPGKLRAELPGVLAWAARGCFEWQRSGLGEPDAVRAATAEYREEMDTLAAFLSEHCVTHPNARTKFSDLYDAYVSWCAGEHENAETKRAFGSRLTERGYPAARGHANTPIRLGLALRSDREPPPGGGRGEGHDGYPSGRENSASATGERENGAARVTETGQGYPTVTAENPCKIEEKDGRVTVGYPKTTSKGLKNPREEWIGKYGNHGNHGNHGNPEDEKRRLTEDQDRKVEQLTSQGMKREIALVEVLGADG